MIEFLGSLNLMESTKYQVSVCDDDETSVYPIFLLVISIWISFFLFCSLSFSFLDAGWEFPKCSLIFLLIIQWPGNGSIILALKQYWFCLSFLSFWNWQGIICLILQASTSTLVLNHYLFYGFGFWKRIFFTQKPFGPVFCISVIGYWGVKCLMVRMLCFVSLWMGSLLFSAVIIFYISLI